MSEKRCTRCGQLKSVTDFGRSARRRDGLQCWCRACWAAYHAAFKAAHPEKIRARRDAYRASEAGRAKISAYNATASRERLLRRQYGLSTADYQALLDAQGGACAICHNPETMIDPRNGAPRRLAVDHDHRTGEVRGLLCQKCNRGIGMFVDEPRLLRVAASYLERSRVRLVEAG